MKILNTDVIINVFTGEVAVVSEPYQLVSPGIGSCIVLAAFSPSPRVGGLAHIMLPGKSPKGAQEPLRYAHDAIRQLESLLKQYDIRLHDCIICLAGGGNVLHRENDSICSDNIKSVLDFLEREHLCIAAKAVGGYQRRSLRLDVAMGRIFCSQGDNPECCLCQ